MMRWHYMTNWVADPVLDAVPPDATRVVGWQWREHLSEGPFLWPEGSPLPEWPSWCGAHAGASGDWTWRGLFEFRAGAWNLLDSCLWEVGAEGQGIGLGAAAGRTARASSANASSTRLEWRLGRR